MYYSLIGDIVFDRDEDFKEQATVCNCVCVAVECSLRDAENTAELIAETLRLDYLVPQAWKGRIYNQTTRPLRIAEDVTIPPQAKFEWERYMNLMEAAEQEWQTSHIKSDY
jgi:hypothetical protein